MSLLLAANPVYTNAGAISVVEMLQPQSGCVVCQQVFASLSSHGFPDFKIAFKVMSSFRRQAIIMTLNTLP
ncbi:MAG TPA: hypothetical protein VMG59_04475, partial [Phycisphaerae bacterium]|nr:hypothetical protein [Phycisphaerae bacterium]